MSYLGILLLISEKNLQILERIIFSYYRLYFMCSLIPLPSLVENSIRRKRDDEHQSSRSTILQHIKVESLSLSALLVVTQYEFSVLHSRSHPRNAPRYLLIRSKMFPFEQTKIKYCTWTQSYYKSTASCSFDPVTKIDPGGALSEGAGVEKLLKLVVVVSHRSSPEWPTRSEEQL